MLTTTITKEKLNNFVICGKHYATNNAESVLKATVEALLEPAIKRLKKVEREKELQRLKLCKKTSSKHVERDRNNNLIFTEADTISIMEKFDEIDQQTIEFPQDIVKEFPEDGLSYDIRSAFEGIVIPKIARKFDSLPDVKEEDSPKEDE